MDRFKVMVAPRILIKLNGLQHKKRNKIGERGRADGGSREMRGRGGDQTTLYTCMKLSKSKFIYKHMKCEGEKDLGHM